MQADTTGETDTIEVVVNGERKCVLPGTSLLGLVRLLELEPSRLAIELDRRIVKQPLWETTPLDHGSIVEIVQFVGGG
jgi:thiamine biosynthesis protein ThiS